jgi:hypothetical protein
MSQATLVQIAKDLKLLTNVNWAFGMEKNRIVFYFDPPLANDHYSDTKKMEWFKRNGVIDDYDKEQAEKVRKHGPNAAPFKLTGIDALKLHELAEATKAKLDTLNKAATLLKLHCQTLNCDVNSRKLMLEGESEIKLSQLPESAVAKIETLASEGQLTVKWQRYGHNLKEIDAVITIPKDPEKLIAKLEPETQELQKKYESYRKAARLLGLATNHRVDLKQVLSDLFDPTAEGVNFVLHESPELYPLRGAFAISTVAYPQAGDNMLKVSIINESKLEEFGKDRLENNRKLAEASDLLSQITGHNWEVVGTPSIVMRMGMRLRDPDLPMYTKTIKSLLASGAIESKQFAKIEQFIAAAKQRKQKLTELKALGEDEFPDSFDEIPPEARKETKTMLIAQLEQADLQDQNSMLRIAISKFDADKLRAAISNPAAWTDRAPLDGPDEEGPEPRGAKRF